MKIPDKVKICGIEYGVKLMQTAVNGSAVCYGTHSYTNTEIEIGEKYSKQVQESAFIHEVVHAIDFLFCLNFKEETVERLRALCLY